MIWQNPLAWLGLLALAVPVLIHLLGRRTARVERFPTLRFLGTSSLVAVRRTRPTDLALLFVRLGILAAAVAALAQPLLLTADRRAASRTLARAIVIDTSASMQRLTPSGERAIDVARRAADSLALDAGTSETMVTATPARQLAGAAAWLENRPGTREIVIISDFQTGVLDADPPVGVGIRLRRIDVVPAGDIVVRGHRGGTGMLARVTFAGGRTDAEWLSSDSVAPADGGVRVLAGADERADADAAQHAAATIAPPSLRQDAHGIVVVYPRYEQRDDLVRDAAPLDQPWMTDLVARLRTDAMLADAAADAVVDSAHVSDQFLPVAANGAGHPVVIAARGTADGNDLLLLVRADAGSLVSAALHAAVSRARATDTPLTELEPDVIPDDVLRAWEREAEPDEASGLAGASDGRWLWLAVLLLLGLETWMRRARRVEET